MSMLLGVSCDESGKHPRIEGINDLPRRCVLIWYCVIRCPMSNQEANFQVPPRLSFVVCQLGQCCSGECERPNMNEDVTDLHERKPPDTAKRFAT